MDQVSVLDKPPLEHQPYQIGLSIARFMQRRKFYPYLLIAAALTVAYLPVLLGVYIRQDDMEYYSWIGMDASLRFDYFNTVYELFRPVSMPLIIFADGLAYDVVDAVWVRLLNIICLIAIAWLVYRWQLRFHANRFFAGAFSVAAFTLPAYQVFVATANYFCILVALVIAVLATEGLWRATCDRLRPLLLIISFVAYFISLMTYQLSAMFSWPMLAIAFLLGIRTIENEKDFRAHCRRLVTVAICLIGAMLLYLLAGNAFLALVNHGGPQGRHLAIDPQLGPKLLHLWQTVLWHSQFWFWWDTGSDVFPFLALVVLFAVALWFRVRRLRRRLIAVSLAFVVIASAFAIAYAPVLAPRDFLASFRYAMATMPLLLYVAFWATEEIVTRLADQRWAILLPTAIAALGVVVCNLMLERHIVGPQDAALAYVRQRLESEALPAIKAGQKVTVAIDCNFARPGIYGYVGAHFEYDLRLWQYQEQCVSAVVHGLRMLGIESTLAPPRSMIHKYGPHNHIVLTQWGAIIATDDGILREQLQKDIGEPIEGPLVSIDEQHADGYRPWSLYTRLIVRRAAAGKCFNRPRGSSWSANGIGLRPI